jgi:membrane protein required for colicin V production
MNFLDIAVIGFTTLSGFITFSIGFVRVVLALVGWVGAIFSTMYLFHYVQPLARQWVSIEIIADGVAGLIIFISSLIVFTLISHTIGSQVRASGLSTLDRTVGLIFGLGLGTIIVSLSYISMIWAMDLPKETAQQPQWIQEAKSRPFLKWGAAQLQSLAPKALGFIPTTPDDTSQMLKQRFEKLVTPETKKTKNKKREGYNQKERREMDRLFKGQQ